MKFWIVGTDTDVGKTTVSAWICLHTKYCYWKPIQTGSNFELSDDDCINDDETTSFHALRSSSVNITSDFNHISMDSSIVKKLSGSNIYPERYVFSAALSPHIAAEMENVEISINEINVPDCENLLIEAAGGLMVPLNKKNMYIDFIKKTNLPVILVAKSSLGTINHTCLSIEALKKRDINLLGVIVNGEKNIENVNSIKKYGNVQILAEIEKVDLVNKDNLFKIPFPQHLREILT